jgi:hypothetical protein
VRLVELLGHFTDDDGTRRVGQAFELLEVLTQICPRAAALERRSNQERTLDRLLNLDCLL